MSAQKATVEAAIADALWFCTMPAEASRRVLRALNDAGFDVVGKMPEPAPFDEAELRKMMRDPRYWRDRDPVFVARVTEGFRCLEGDRA